MKINREEIFLSNLESSFTNRKKELSDFFLLAKAHKETELSETINKAFVLLLYAHWERFVKENLDAYFFFINSKNKKVNDLTENFRYIHLKNNLKAYSLSSSLEQEKKIINSVYVNKNVKFKIPILEEDNKKTNYYSNYILNESGNLNYKDYISACSKINYEIKDESKLFKINLTKLTHNRHSIAHTGMKAKENSYTDIEDIENIQQSIFQEMENFKFFLINNVEHELYLSSMHITKKVL